MKNFYTGYGNSQKNCNGGTKLAVAIAEKYYYPGQKQCNQ